MVECPNCGVDNPKSSKYCQECGAQLKKKRKNKVSNNELIGILIIIVILIVLIIRING